MPLLHRRAAPSASGGQRGRGGRGPGRILAIKWGYNPNSSSLGVDVTFLLFGMLAVALLTPLVAMVLRARGLLGAVQQSPATPAAASTTSVDDSPSGERADPA